MTSREAIFGWLTDVLSSGLPTEVKALYINLVETDADVDVELFGIGEFDPNDEDWACEDVYQGESLTLQNVMQRPEDWKKLLKDIASVISDYADHHQDNPGLAPLSRIGVGFGDSEIVLVKNRI